MLRLWRFWTWLKETSAVSRKREIKESVLVSSPFSSRRAWAVGFNLLLLQPQLATDGLSLKALPPHKTLLDYSLWLSGGSCFFPILTSYSSFPVFHHLTTVKWAQCWPNGCDGLDFTFVSQNIFFLLDLFISTEMHTWPSDQTKQAGFIS